MARRNDALLEHPRGPELEVHVGPMDRDRATRSDEYAAVMQGLVDRAQPVVACVPLALGGHEYLGAAAEEGQAPVEWDSSASRSM